jgi:hypothetical protein
MQFCEMLQPKPPLLVNTPKPKQLVFTSARLAVLNYLGAKPSFTQVVAGHPFMHPLKMMPLSFWKIVP